MQAVVYGYSLDDSDFPCYFLWPHRTQEDNFWLLESQTHRYVDLSLADFLQPLGIRHFYDAFGLKVEVSIGAAALEAFQLQEGDLSRDLLVTADAARARGWTDHKEQPVDQNVPEADLRNVRIDVISVTVTPLVEKTVAMTVTGTHQALKIALAVSPLLLKCLISIPCWSMLMMPPRMHSTLIRMALFKVAMPLSI